MFKAETPIILATLIALAQAHGHHSIRLPLHKRNTQAASLFSKRQSNYPKMDQIGPAPLQAWVDTYNRVKKAGAIPSIPVSTNDAGWPTYPTGINTTDPSICSFSLSHCSMSEDIVDAPDGVLGLSFDDAPQAPSPEMFDFLQQNNIPATHFLIGSRCLEFPDEFAQLHKMGGHLAVHTWSHPLLSTLTDTQILGELGWTMQIIYDMTGGLVPSFYRPPYGDCDMRVRAIAKNVFGLRTVLWGYDSKDWCLSDDGTNSCNTTQNPGPKTDSGLLKELQGWFSGPKSPGIIVLEHEHHNRSIAGFINAWPTIQQNNWNVKNIADSFGYAWYLNAKDNTVTPAAMSIGNGNSAASGTQATATGSTKSAATASPSAGSHNTAASENAWTKLSKTAQYGIIGGAAGAGVLLAALIAGCCLWRRKKKRQAAASEQPSLLSKIGWPVGGGPIVAGMTSDKAPYHQFDSSPPSSYGEKRPFDSPEQAAYPDLRTSPPEQIELRHTPSPSPPKSGGFLAVPSKTGGRNSSLSVYSQGSSAEELVDPFAPAIPKLTSSISSASSTTSSAARKSNFHLPNRFGASPYVDKKSDEWI